MKKMLFRCFAAPAIAIALFVVFAFAGLAAELRDYRLPSEKQQGTYSTVVSGVKKADPYDAFCAQVEKLTPSQKNQLRSSLNQKVKSTTTESERNYYLNLIRIINESEAKHRTR